MIWRGIYLAAGLLLAGGAGAVPAGEKEPIRADVCVVGGGSAGIGAALAASRAGANVVLIERRDSLGGTSTQGYVCNWEPGPGCSFAREIYTRLAKIPRAAGITREYNADRSRGPFGLWLLDPDATYDDTLRRGDLSRDKLRAVVFDPDRFAAVVSDMLKETSRCRVLLGTTFLRVEAKDRRVLSIRADAKGGKEWEIAAKVFIDCTGDAHLCRDAGCRIMTGVESSDRFGEPSAPKQGEDSLNAISLCYRITQAEGPAPASQPAGRPPSRTAHVSALPGGDLIVNPLALMPGKALIEKGYDPCLTECRRLAESHWDWLRTYPEFAAYRLRDVAPMLGIRESYRVVGRYVLTELDLKAGLSGQTHADIIATADHLMDIHGNSSRPKQAILKEAYGIPYRCLVPDGWKNLLVAGRCASFSHLAASSCRLSRTMIALGHAAGLAAASAARTGLPVAKVDVAEIQKQLGVERPAP